MARLLVVSRSMALALRLADTHHVVEAPLESLGELGPAPDVDAVVLDVGDPALAVRTIDRLRRAGDTTPLLVVSGYQPAWAGLAAVDLPSVVVVPLPVTRGALLEGIDRLTQAPPVPGPAGGTAGAAEPLVRPYRVPAPGPAVSPATGLPVGPAAGTAPRPAAEASTGAAATGGGGGPAVTRPIPVMGRPAPVTGWDPGTAATGGDADREGNPRPDPLRGRGEDDGNWQGGGFDWWTADVVDEAMDDAADHDTVDHDAADHDADYDTADYDTADHDAADHHAADHHAVDDPAQVLRRGWPPAGAEAPPSPRGPRSAGTATRPQPPPEPVPGVTGREALSGSLLGRSAHGAAEMSVFRRRLGGRPYTTSLGPGGSSPELVALGAAGGDDSDSGISRGDVSYDDVSYDDDSYDDDSYDDDSDSDVSDSGVEVRRSATDQGPGEPLPDLSVEPSLMLPPADRAAEAADLVGRLLDRVTAVVGVPDAARATAERSVAATGAEASAVLVPDGGLWRVAGAVGLPDPERHLVLDGAHWLVDLLGAPGVATGPVVVRGPGAVPHRSGELPLAARPHVLAVAVPGSQAVVLVARGRPGPFGPDDARSLRRVAEEAAGLLAGALRVRHLARLLAPLRS